MPNTYTLIASSTVGSGGAANIDFTSIPSTYTDLAVLVSCRTTATGTAADFFLFASFNGLTTNRIYKRLEGYNGGAGSDSGTNTAAGMMGGTTATANTFSNNFIYIPNYSLTSINKSYSVDFASESNNSTQYDLGFFTGLWSSTAAINQITLSPSGGNFAQYSTAYLYGIKNS